MRHNFGVRLAMIVSAAALVGVGCRGQGSTSYESTTDNPLNLQWAPYTTEWGADTGVTGSSASPYAGGKAVVTQPMPATYVPSTYQPSTYSPATTTTPTTTTRPTHGVTETMTKETTTTIRRY
jgi:hypothetical protein